MSFTLEQFHREYETDAHTFKIGSRRLTYLKPSSIDCYIDGQNGMHDFPLWAKVWESSAILCTYLANLQVTPGQRLLEIGAGMGIAGITAAALGHDITITEHDPHALNFIRANCRINGLPRIKVRYLDWNRPDMHHRFDLIIGSDITYKEQNIPILTSLFHNLLAPGGTIVLAEEVRETGAAFMDAMTPCYDIEAGKHQLRSAHKSLTVILFKLRPKEMC